MNKLISEKLLRASLKLIDLHDRQIELTKQTLKAITARRNTYAELVRANLSGDRVAMKVLKDGILASNGNGTLRPYYDRGMTDEVTTKRKVQVAREWIAQRGEVDEQDQPVLP